VRLQDWVRIAWQRIGTMCARADIPQKVQQRLFIFDESRHRELLQQRRLLGRIGNSHPFDLGEGRKFVHAIGAL
jgi:hypothetical protein